MSKAVLLVILICLLVISEFRATTSIPTSTTTTVPTCPQSITNCSNPDGSVYCGESISGCLNTNDWKYYRVPDAAGKDITVNLTHSGSGCNFNDMYILNDSCNNIIYLSDDDGWTDTWSGTPTSAIRIRIDGDTYKNPNCQWTLDISCEGVTTTTTPVATSTTTLPLTTTTIPETTTTIHTTTSTTTLPPVTTTTTVPTGNISCQPCTTERCECSVSGYQDTGILRIWDEIGCFELDVKYDVYVENSSAVWYPENEGTYYARFFDGSYSTPFTLEVAEAYHGTGILEVEVVDKSTGKPLPMTSVYVIYSEGQEPEKIGSTDSRGIFEKSLPSGDIRIIVDANTYFIGEKDVTLISDTTRYVRFELEKPPTDRLFEPPTGFEKYTSADTIDVQIQEPFITEYLVTIHPLEDKLRAYSYYIVRDCLTDSCSKEGVVEKVMGNIETFLYTHTEFEFSDYDLIKIYPQYHGACMDYSFLTTSFINSYGIPTRSVFADFGHFWNEVYTNGEWVHLDISLDLYDDPCWYARDGLNRGYCIDKVIAFEPDGTEEDRIDFYVCGNPCEPEETTTTTTSTSTTIPTCPDDCSDYDGDCINCINHCVAAESCGYCKGDNTCRLGTASGPYDSEGCGEWAWYTSQCPTGTTTTSTTTTTIPSCPTIVSCANPSSVNSGDKINFVFCSNAVFTYVDGDDDPDLVKNCVLKDTTCTGDGSGYCGVCLGYDCWWRWGCTARDVASIQAGTFRFHCDPPCEYSDCDYYTSFTVNPVSTTTTTTSTTTTTTPSCIQWFETTYGQDCTEYCHSINAVPACDSCTAIQGYIEGQGALACYGQSNSWCLNTPDKNCGQPATLSSCPSPSAYYDHQKCCCDICTIPDITSPTLHLKSIGGDTTEPYITDTTPEVIFTADKKAWCGMSRNDYSYDEMVEEYGGEPWHLDRICHGQGADPGNDHVCTLDSEFTVGSHTLYVACKDEAGNKHLRDNNYEWSFEVDCDSDKTNCDSDLCRDNLCDGSCWDLGGEVSATTCCGDDGGEDYKTRESAHDSGDGLFLTGDDPSDKECCSNFGNCVYNGICFSNYENDACTLEYSSRHGDGLRCSYDITGDDRRDGLCFDGRWYDCDTSFYDCETNCGYHYVASGDGAFGEYTHTGDNGCCGDDDVEYYETCKDYSEEQGWRSVIPWTCDSSIDACCNDYDCVDNSGTCRQGTGNTANFGNISYFHFNLNPGGNDNIAFCYNGGNNPRWLDCDEHEWYSNWCSNADVCGSTDGVISGESSPHGEYSSSDISNWKQECCGDDTGEHYITKSCKVGPSEEPLCCDNPNDRILEGYCVDYCLTFYADSDLGVAPLNGVDLITEISGSQGHINYAFDCDTSDETGGGDCTENGYYTDCEAVYDDIDLSTIPTSWTSKTDENGNTYYVKRIDTDRFAVKDVCDYDSADIYTAKVLVERGGSTRTATVLIRVSPSQSEIPLAHGWNFISLPLEPVNNSIEAIIEPIEDSIRFIRTYDSNTGWVSSTDGTLTTMEPGKAYWVYAAEDIILPLDGDPFEYSEIELEADQYYYIGAPTQSTRISDMLGTCDPENIIFYAHVPGTEGDFIELDIDSAFLEPKKGYVIFNSNIDCMFGSGVQPPATLQTIVDFLSSIPLIGRLFR